MQLWGRGIQPRRLVSRTPIWCLVVLALTRVSAFGVARISALVGSMPQVGRDLLVTRRTCSHICHRRSARHLIFGHARRPARGGFAQLGEQLIAELVVAGVAPLRCHRVPFPKIVVASWRGLWGGAGVGPSRLPCRRPSRERGHEAHRA